VAHPFWKAWRRHVRAINPKAYIVGELIADEDDLSPYLQGDEFDAAMNYEFAVIAAEFFIQTTERTNATEFDRRLRALREKYPAQVAYVMQNLFGSHDTARLGTHIVNHGLFNYRDWTAYHRMAKAENGAPVDLRQPTEAERQIQKLLAIFQMTYVGAPMIYYGDEAGMWGANDPCCRKPMLWPELDFEPELYLPDGGKREVGTAVQFNQSLFNHYKKLIHIRSSSPALQVGSFETLLADGDVYAFRRCLADETVIVVLNRDTVEHSISLPDVGQETFVDLLNDNEPHQINNVRLTLPVAAQWGAILCSIGSAGVSPAGADETSALPV
jgi:glycosidase